MEHNILLFVQENVRLEWLNDFMVGFTTLGEHGILGIIAVVALIAYPRTRKIGVIAALSFIIGAVVMRGVIKNLAMRPRPFAEFSDLILLGPKPNDYSFPSGHTMAMFSVAWILLRSEFVKLKWIFLCASLLMGLSRMYVCAHYPTDVLGGIVISFIGSYIAWEWAKRIKFVQKL